jgi:hypothetical protein
MRIPLREWIGSIRRSSVLPRSEGFSRDALAYARQLAKAKVGEHIDWDLPKGSVLTIDQATAIAHSVIWGKESKYSWAMQRYHTRELWRSYSTPPPAVATGLSADLLKECWYIGFRSAPGSLTLSRQGSRDLTFGDHPILFYVPSFDSLFSRLKHLILTGGRFANPCYDMDSIMQPTRLVGLHRNIEIRRLLIEKYGFERYVKEGGFELVQQDKFGRLYRKHLPGETPVAFAEVTNSTPETDGSRKKYILRVPPSMRTAHEAVAASFGLRPEQYNPSHES